MITEIYRIISSTGSNLSERLKDMLTENIFGTLRYIPAERIIISFLQKGGDYGVVNSML